MVSRIRRRRFLAFGVAAIGLLAGCGVNPRPSQPQASAVATPPPQKGGTIYVLSQNEQWDQVDPQRIYSPDDLAFFGATLFRSLEAFTLSPDPTVAGVLQPDMATDLGRHNADATQWQFTLRDGVTWQDGSPITCQDVKYGVSRTFATDVINQGPVYAIEYLDIPRDENGISAYKGPYSEIGQALFDKAVTCNGKTITFNLAKPVADFNDAVTEGFFPIPKRLDSGETYGEPGHLAMASGPYEVRSYTMGRGGKMVLVRNPNWNQANDPIRKAYPDGWEIDFGLDPDAIDHRLMASAGKDATAVQFGQIQPRDLATMFDGTGNAKPNFTARALNAFDAYTRYLWVDVRRVPNADVRRAMWVALDRSAIRDAMGGTLTGDFADGVLKPSIGPDYAPTGLLGGTLDWLDGHTVPPAGDLALAKQLIQRSGVRIPELSFQFNDLPIEARVAAIVKSSLGKAGIPVKLDPIEASQYNVFPRQDDFGISGWGADWPNASTVFSAIFTKVGGWDQSQVDDPELNREIEAADRELDRTKQSQDWQALNREVVEEMYVLPTFFTKTQRLAGTNVGPVYSWAPYSSWPYAAMYVKR